MQNHDLHVLPSQPVHRANIVSVTVLVDMMLGECSLIIIITLTSSLTPPVLSLSTCSPARPVLLPPPYIRLKVSLEIFS